MAALMRYGMHKFASFGRSFINVNSVITRPGVSAPLVQRFLATTVQPKDKILGDVAYKIDYNQGISTQLFNSLVASLESHGSLSEQDIALLLHICSSGPFDCSTDKRLAYVEEIWKKMKTYDISPSKKLFNVRLKAYCLNNKVFNPLDELMHLKSLSLNPDKFTYSLLIEAFCQKGDIEGANSVLEAMKVDNLIVNLAVFNSFITGHLKAGSPDEATKVLELIRSSGLSPNSKSYFKFASHYAEEGDLDSVLKYISEAEETGVPLDQDMLLDLYKTMVTSGHSASTEKLLQIASERGIYRSAFLQKSCHLLSEGYKDAAVELYMNMPTLDEGKPLPNSGQFLLKCMVINNYSAVEVFSMADRLLEINPRALHAHRIALRYAYRDGRTDLAMDLMELMKAKNHKIKVPYVTPAVCSYRNENNVEGVYKATELLLNITSAEAREDKFDHLLFSSLPALKSLNQSREDVTDRFKDHEKLWNSLFFLHDLDKHGFDTAVANAEGKEMDRSAFQIKAAENVFCKYSDVDSCLKTLEVIREKKYLNEGNFSYICSAVVRSPILNKDWDLLEKLLDGLLEKEIFLEQNLKQMKILQEAPTNIMEKLEKLCISPQKNSSAMKGYYLPMSKLETMSDEEVKQYIKKNPEAFLPRLMLVKKACDANDLESLKQILREIQALKQTISPGTQVEVIRKLARLHDTESALFHFEELKKQTGNDHRSTIPLTIAEELVKQGKVEGAVEMIQAAKLSERAEDVRAKTLKRNMLGSILESAPTIHDASRLHSVMFEDKPIVSETKPVHNAYIKRLLLEDDDSALIEALKHIYHTFDYFPSHDAVLQRFIKKKDVENLKTVMDLGNMAFGKNFLHHKLAINFIECGMPSRGATILKTPGFSLNYGLLNACCQQLIKTKQISHLESVVEVLQTLPMGQARLLRYLVEGHVAIGNLQSATEAIQQYAIDITEPPNDIVNIVVQEYTKNGEQIPNSLQSFISQRSQPEEKLESEAQSEDTSSEQRLENETSSDSKS